MCESLQTSDIWLTCHSLASGRTPAGPPSQRKARTPLWSGYQQGSPAREQAIVAHEQGQLFGVEITSKVQRCPLIAYLDETVSGWPCAQHRGLDVQYLLVPESSSNWPATGSSSTHSPASTMAFHTVALMRHKGGKQCTSSLWRALQKRQLLWPNQAS